VIHVDPQPEPPAFDARVRQPGQRVLAEGRDVLPPLWQACLPDLYERYRGVCAYLCVYIPRATGARSVDHFVPKSRRRDLAYEWTNYRLACSLMNSRKRDFDDVLDPFEIRDGWFVLELSFLQVMPAPSLDGPTRAQVQATIDRLGLNDKECIAARAQHYQPYVEGQLTFELLSEWSPFVARQVGPHPPTGTTPTSGTAPVPTMATGATITTLAPPAAAPVSQRSPDSAREQPG
jgi:hypothetical protein